VIALRWLVLAAALGALALAVWQLEGARAGLVRTPLAGTGTTPATVWRLAAADPAAAPAAAPAATPAATPVPVAVIAHGFAGSRQLMEGFAEVLARAGYIAVTFDFEGHGANPVPMSGDVTSVAGTTQRLMDEVGRVSDAALALPGADGRLALVGHSMASDIVVRQALADPRIGAVVAVSMFSEAVTAEAPANLLVVAGAWEGLLAEEAGKALRLADPGATPGHTVAIGPRNARRAVLAPGVEHVGVLYAATTLAETRAWLDRSFGRAAPGAAAGASSGASSGAPPEASPPRRGGAILLALAAAVALAWPLAGALARWQARIPPDRLPRGDFLTALGAAAIGTPLLLWPVQTGFLPVLVADYLVLHFALYGLLVLGILVLRGAVRLEPGARWVAAAALALPVALLTVGLFGGLLERYVAAFWTASRLWLVGAVALGAVPFMLADAALTEGGRAPFSRAALARGAALASLGLAVALDFERLFFLIIVLPVILVFFAVFGMVGGWIGRATWRPFAAGLGLGLFLAWTVGMTFPLFSA
jgi:dienelactone hydrolase